MAYMAHIWFPIVLYQSLSDFLSVYVSLSISLSRTLIYLLTHPLTLLPSGVRIRFNDLKPTHQT